MRTVRRQGLTFRITQPHGLRSYYLRMHPSLRKELNRILTGLSRCFYITITRQNTIGE